MWHSPFSFFTIRLVHKHDVVGHTIPSRYSQSPASWSKLATSSTKRHQSSWMCYTKWRSLPAYVRKCYVYVLVCLSLLSGSCCAAQTTLATNVVFLLQSTHSKCICNKLSLSLMYKESKRQAAQAARVLSYRVMFAALQSHLVWRWRSMDDVLDIGRWCCVRDDRKDKRSVVHWDQL